MAYISPWLTHFVGRQQLTDSAAQCHLLVSILREGRLGQWGRQDNVLFDPGTKIISGGSLCRDEFIRFRPVCFCDIPEESLERHTSLYGRFGLAFNKDFLVAKGANPVFYVAKGSLACHERPAVPPLTEEDLEADAQTALRKHLAALSAEPVPVRRCEFFDRLVADLMKILPPKWPAGTPAEAYDPVRGVQTRVLWDLLTHVFAFTKFFDESLPEEDRENFYMEREWRVAGFVSFELRDVQRVYVEPGFRERIECEFSGLGVHELRDSAP
jgi:hypothetical protein